MRLVTRSDFDGLGCAVLLKEVGVVDDIKFVHPKDVQDGLIEVDCDDILTNVPYVPGCGMWFDHHSSENERRSFGYFIGSSDPSAPSAASVVYNYYGGKERFNNSRFDELIKAVNKADSAQFTIDEVLHPKGWALLAFIMDPRTGLGRYRDYRISNYQLMFDMIDYCRTKTVDEIMEVEDVQERVRRYFEQDALFRDMIKKCSSIRENVLVIDLRDQEEIYTGNRFIPYCLFPDQNISIHVLWGFRKQNIVFTCGHSILNRTSKTDVGSLMLKHGGGGHEKVGTCQVSIDKADQVFEEIVKKLNDDG